MRGRAVAGLVAVVLAAGLGACGNSTSGDGGAKDAAGRPLLPSSASRGGAAGSEAMVKSAPVAGDASAVAEPMMAPIQQVEYRLADGAKAPATTAPAYRVARSDDLSAKDVAKALGLSADEAGDVEVETGLGWYYAPSGEEGDQTVSSGVAVSCAPSTPAPIQSVPEDDCGAVQLPTPPAGVPTAAEAEARFRKVLDALGVDVAKGKIEADDGDNAFARSVRFTPEVDGSPVTGLETTVSYGGAGKLEYANGFSGRFEKLGDYPLVGLDEAFRRFQDGGGGFGSGGRPEPMVARGTAVPADAATSAPTEDGGPVMTIEPQPMPPVQLDPRIVEITGAEVVLSLVYPDCEDGDFLVVPTYRLQTDDEAMSGLEVPAVADASLEDGGASATADKGTADDAAPCPEDDGVDLPAPEPGAKPEPVTTVVGGDATGGAVTGSAGTSGSSGSTGGGSTGTGTGRGTAEPAPPAKP